MGERIDEILCIILGHKYVQRFDLEGKYYCKRCGRIEEQIKRIPIHGKG